MTISSQDLVAMFIAVADAVEADKDRLSELDGVIGDADHGVSLGIGFSAVKDAVAGLDASAEPVTVFNTAAKSFLNAVGASSGPLYATAFMRAGAAVKGKAELDRDAMVAVIAAMAKGIQDRGKAERGDKTMVDAWLPAAEAIAEAAQNGAGVGDCLTRRPGPRRKEPKPPRQCSPRRGGRPAWASARSAMWTPERPRRR